MAQQLMFAACPILISVCMINHWQMVTWKVLIWLRGYSSPWQETNIRTQGRYLEVGTEVETWKEQNYVIISYYWIISSGYLSYPS